jgi:hypothetical protein
MKESKTFSTETSKPIIPKSVLNAEKLLKITYPEVYKKLSAWRNTGYLTEPDLERIKFHVERCGVVWNVIQSNVFSFLNIVPGSNGELPEPPEAMDKMKRPAIKITRWRSSNHNDPKTYTKSYHSHKAALS